MAWQPDFFGRGHSFEQEVNEAGYALTTRWEVKKNTRYPDNHKGGSRWCIGFGHAEGGDNWPKEIPADLVLTDDQCMDILKSDFHTKGRWLKQKIHVPVTNFMYSALMDLLINVGEGNFDHGPVLGFLNQERYMAAADAFHYHNKTWQQVLDADGKPVLIPDDTRPGEMRVLTELVKNNGLSVRRSCEVALFSTKID